MWLCGGEGGGRGGHLLGLDYQRGMRTLLVRLSLSDLVDVIVAIAMNISVVVTSKDDHQLCEVMEALV